MRKKKHSTLCASCDRGIREGQKICDCGAATKYMDFAERTRYEVEQWRAHRGTAIAS